MLKEEGGLQDLLEVFGGWICLSCLKERVCLWCRRTGQGRSSQGHQNISLNEILSLPMRPPCPEHVLAGIACGHCVLSTIQEMVCSPGLLVSHTKSFSLFFSSSSHNSTAVCQALLWNICPQKHFVFFKHPFLSKWPSHSSVNLHRFLLLVTRDLHYCPSQLAWYFVVGRGQM